MTTIQQMFVALLCYLLATQQITAVVNNAKSNLEEVTTKNATVSTNLVDSVSAGTGQEPKRREAPTIVISDNYGVPLTGGGIDSYIPSGPSNPSLPIPVYGVPDAPSNNIVYPAPPPDIPPPLPAISSNYGTPLKTYGPPQLLNNLIDNLGPPPPPPNNNYGPPIRPPKPFISTSYHGLKSPRPRPQYGPPKPIFVPKLSKPNYGSPRPLYGPPKLSGKPLFVPQKNNFKQQTVTIVTVPNINIGHLQDEYGPPPPAPSGGYLGPPEPIPHGPPHPGVPAPPTPPDIKYDGWQPIPGLVSRPPSGTYQVSEEHHHGSEDLHFNTDFIPPPIEGGHSSHSSHDGHVGISSHISSSGSHSNHDGHVGHGGGLGISSHISSLSSSGGHSNLDGHVGHGSGLGISSLSSNGHDNHDGHGSGLGISSHASSLSSSSHSISGGYSSSHGVSDSYGAPLNAVTGSGGIVSSSGDSHHDDQSLSLGLSAAGINTGQSHLSVVKSIEYELFPNSGGGLSHIGGGNSYLADSYSSPPLSSYSLNGPYAAAHSHTTNGLSSGSSFGTSIKSHLNSHNFHGSHGSHGLSLSSSAIGLIPPSGFYGTLPSGHYGTPLLSKPSVQYGAPLNALKINPPKHPVIFREPVPVGLIESIGQHTAHKDAHGIIESSHSNSYTGPTYIPPPIPDVTKPVKEEEPPEPSHLYSLPNPASSISFQNLGHSSSSTGLGAYNSFGSGSFGGGHSHAQILTSYTAPLGSVDGSYSLPLHSGHGYSVALDNAKLGGVTVDIDNTHPPLTIDLTSSTTNIGSNIAQVPHTYSYQNLQHDCSSHSSQPLPSLSYGVPSANSYTASLSSLKTNIGGAYQGSSSSLNYNSHDLHASHSQKVSSSASANAIENDSHEKNYGKSLTASFGPESELVKSQSIDINNIPLQGALGSYTLQIQPADSLGASGAPDPVPHAQVLNDGLLQSILAAIEQPNRKDIRILGQPLLHLQPNQQSYDPQVPPSAPEDAEDVEGQHSMTNEVVVSPPVTEATTSTNVTTSEPESDVDTSLRLIDNNEIALYFSNNSQDTIETTSSVSQQNSTVGMEAVRNGQQYGNYVTFKRPNGDSVLGNVPTDKETEKKD